MKRRWIHVLIAAMALSGAGTANAQELASLGIESVENVSLGGSADSALSTDSVGGSSVSGSIEAITPILGSMAIGGLFFFGPQYIRDSQINIDRFPGQPCTMWEVGTHSRNGLECKYFVGFSSPVWA